MVVWNFIWGRIPQALCRLIGLVLLVILAASGPGMVGTASAQETVTSAVVLMYHRFGEDDYASTSVTM